METNSFLALMILAAVVEALWQNLKMVWDKGKFQVNVIGSLLLGILVCLATGVDFFVMVGLPLCIPILGYILSGILISRGANFVHDFLGGVENFRTGGKKS
jgi:uncharacterized membrane protein